MSNRIFILLVSILIIFFPCFKAGFVNLDDTTHLLSNPALQHLSPNSIKEIFTQAPNRIYIPLTVLSFAVEKYFFGFNPFIYHFDNVVLFAAIVVMVFLLALRMGLSLNAGFLAAFIFLIHPMKVESVAWVTERKDVLYAFFYLLALHQYCSYLKSESLRNYVTAAIFGLLSIMAKPMAVSLPLVLFIFDWFYGRPLSRRLLIEKIPFILYILAIASITYVLNLKYSSGHMSFLIWNWSLIFYLWKFIFPFHLSPFYHLPYPVGITQWPYLFSLVFSLILAVFLVRWRKYKLLIFAFLYFFVSIFFLLPFDAKYFRVVNDRFMLLPSMGFCFLIADMVERQLKGGWGKILFFAYLALLGVTTNLKCYEWRDSLTFWNAYIHHYPYDPRAFNNRGILLKGAASLSDFNKAISLDPQYAKAYNNRGVFYYLRGMDKLAMADFKESIFLDPKDPDVYNDRSYLEEANKQYSLALKDALLAQKLGGLVDEAYMVRLKEKSNM